MKLEPNEEEDSTQVESYKTHNLCIHCIIPTPN